MRQNNSSIMPKKMKNAGKPSVHGELQGFDIRIDEFGEMKTSFAVDKINAFLNENVDDKKLRKTEEE